MESTPPQAVIYSRLGSAYAPPVADHYFLGSSSRGSSACQKLFFALSQVPPTPARALTLLGVVGTLGVSVTSSLGRLAETWTPKTALLQFLGLPPVPLPSPAVLRDRSHQ